MPSIDHRTLACTLVDVGAAGREYREDCFAVPLSGELEIGIISGYR